MYNEIMDSLAQRTTPVTFNMLQKVNKLFNKIKYEPFEDEVEATYQGIEPSHVVTQDVLHILEKHLNIICDSVGVKFTDDAQLHFIVERLYLIMFLRNVEAVQEEFDEELWLANILAERMETQPYKEIEYIVSADKLYANVRKLSEFLTDKDVPDNSSFVAMLTTLIGALGERKLPVHLKDIRNITDVSFESIVKMIDYKMSDTDVATTIMFGTIIDADYRAYSLEDRIELIVDVNIPEERELEIVTIFNDLVKTFHGIHTL
jgi:hypothetical protein